MPSDRDHFTPPQLARLRGISTTKILGWIRRQHGDRRERQAPTMENPKAGDRGLWRPAPGTKGDTMTQAATDTVTADITADPETGLWKVEQVALYLNVCVRSVHLWTGKGDLPGKTKIGKSARWRRAEVEDWVRRGCPSARKVGH
jgi:predicted DNA-binding transcriptional regulator AlpA